jgi:hypothetical protein
MTTSVRTRIVEPIDPADFLATSQAIQSDLEALHSRPRSIGIPWAAVALGAVIGAGIVAIAGLVL